MVKDGIDATSVEGASTLPYAIPNLAVELHSPKRRRAGAVVALGRLDAHRVLDRDVHRRARRSRRARIRSRSAARCSAKHPRHLAALELAARQGRLGQAARRRQGRREARPRRRRARVVQHRRRAGRRSHRRQGRQRSRVDRVVCAVDCGIAVNPDVVRAQMEGGIGFGLSAALYGAITLKDGVVEQSNFHDYPVLRINEMPAVEVHIVPSTEKPTGVGEPGVPVIAPAVANALAAATGKRLRTLPLKLGLTARRDRRAHAGGIRARARAARSRCPPARIAFAFRDGKVLVSGGVEADVAAASARWSELAALGSRRRRALPRARSAASTASRSAWPTTRPNRRRGATPACARCSSRCPDPLLALAARAFQIVDWDRTHRYCGRCGTPTRDKPDERAKECPACGLVAYPRVSPAMMALVTRGPRDPARARASLSRRACSARSPASSSRARRSRTASAARCARKSASRSAALDVLREPVVGVPAFADDRVHRRVRGRRAPARRRRDRRGALVRRSTRCRSCRRACRSRAG